MLNRSSYYKKPRGEKVENIRVMKRIDEVYLKHPCYGSRRMMHILNQEGVRISRHRVRRLMQIMGIQAIYQQPRTSLKAPEHKVYPYLLKNLTIERSNHVWCSDITYVPMRRGFMYLTAIMDWYSRKVLSWRLSNTLDTRFCLESLEEAIGIYGKPDIFNTDQGAQYTSQAFTGSLEKNGIQISMDGKGRWVDNVMIERLWRSVKYECLYLQEFDDIRGLNNTLQAWIDFYNKERPHSTFNGRTPSDVYYENLQKLAA
jgi:putative transposase